MYCIDYIIKTGDTLYTISRHYNVPIDAIMKANPFVNVYSLQAGEVLCIPVSTPQKKYTHFTTYLVKEGDTLGSVLDNNDMNLADFMELNDMNSISLEPGSTLKVPITGEGESGVTL